MVRNRKIKLKFPEIKEVKTPIKGKLVGVHVICDFKIKDVRRIEKAAKKLDMSLIEFIQEAAITAAVNQS